jgi:hypothetical protein
MARFKPQPFGGSGGGGGGAPTIVQTGANAGASITGLVLPGAPAQNNLLVCIWFGSGDTSPGAGWVDMGEGDAVPHDFAEIYYKLCGAGETAAQNPLSAGTSAAMHIWEIKPAIPGFWADAFNAAASVLAKSISVGKSSLVLGAVEVTSSGVTAYPTTVTNGAFDSQFSDAAARSIQGFHNTQAAGALTYTANYAAAHYLQMQLCAAS